MYDVILCSDINHLSYQYGRPAGIYRLASHLRDHGYKVKTINFFSKLTEAEFSALIDQFVSAQTVLFGISATVLRDTQTGNFFGISEQELTARLQKVQAKNCNVKSVLGGGQVNNTSREKINQFTMFDYVITGQGETAMLALIDHLTKNTKLMTSTVQKPKLITDASYPFTEFNQTKVLFHEDDCVLPGEALPLELARGCVFKCKFCSYDLTNKNFFEFTKDRTLLHQEFIYNYEKFGTQYYNVVDDLINDSEEKVDMLLEVIESLPFKIYMAGYIRLDLIWRFPDMADKLKRIGLIACFMGIETINDASGRAVGKGLGKKRIEQALEYCYNSWQGQVFIHAGMILGLPKDTEHTAKELATWGIDMLNRGRLQTIGVTPMSINPWLGKAEIDKDPSSFGYTILNNAHSDNSTRFVGSEANWHTKNYSFTQAQTDSEECNKVFRSLVKLQGIDVFNMPFIMSLLPVPLRKTIESTLLLPVNLQHRRNLYNIVYQHVDAYQRRYITELAQS